VPISRRGRRIGVGAALAVALLTGLAVLVTVRQVAPSLLTSSGCVAKANGEALPLATGQAGIAATIAGVARQDALPRRAVTVAYATALQESKLQNLHYGDRDSVGIFQQRPSQGWGTTRQLENPVYATTKFFAALARVPGYLHLPVYQAAQAVQHSADGTAYSQYVPSASVLAGAFTGRAPHAVWCWFSGAGHGQAKLTAAARGLTRAFGQLPVHRAADPVLAVRVRGTADGWAVAAWLVSHSGSYLISGVRYDGYQWTAAKGGSGWTRERAGRLTPAPRGSVVLG
jgi:hypothetical protein